MKSTTQAPSATQASKTLALRGELKLAKRSLREQTRALTQARRLAATETRLRKAAEERFSKGALHCGQLVIQAKQLEARSKLLAHQILSAQEDERRKISRELHDEIAQVLAGINVQLAALSAASSLNNTNLRDKLTHTQKLVARSVMIIHQYARELRPAMLDDLGLIPALRAFLKDLPGRKRLRIRFTAFSEVENLSNNGRTVLYRVAQEALTNVIRHAKATQVSIRITRQGEAARLVIHDNGQAFDVNSTPEQGATRRLGLIGMQERVEMVGGRFRIDSSPGRGTMITAEVPLAQASRKERK